MAWSERGDREIKIHGWKVLGQSNSREQLGKTGVDKKGLEKQEVRVQEPSWKSTAALQVRFLTPECGW